MMRGAARIASQSAVIYGMRLGGAAITFLMQAALARWWGADQLGQYLVLTAVLNIVAMTMPLGFQVIGNYFTAEYMSAQRTRLLRAFAWRAYLHIAIVFGATLVVSYLFQQRIGDALKLSPHALLPGTIMAAATAIVFVNGALLSGAKHPIAGLIADALLKPIAFLLGFVLASHLVDADERFVALIWIGAILYIAAAALQMRRAIQVIAPLNGDIADASAESRRWWRFALPWVAISLATDFFFDIDLLLLTHLMSLEQLAVFGVCTRIFALIAFGVGLVYTIAMPDMLNAHQNDEKEEFHRRTSDANLMAGGFAATMGIAALFSEPLLGLFGAGFAAGNIPLAILCVSLAIRSIVGPSALLLSLHDKPYASLPPIIVGLAALVLGNYLLVPPFGMTGAATAATLAMSIWSVLQWIVARRHTGTDVSIWPRLRDAVFKPQPTRG